MGTLLVGNSSPNTTRMNGIFMTYLFFLTSGIWTVLGWLKKLWQKRTFGLLIGLTYAVYFLHFINYYFTDYTKDTFPMYLFYEPYEGIREFKDDNKEAPWANRITCYPWNYVYYMLEFRIDPWEINIPATGDPGWGCDFPGDYIRGYPDDLILTANYVVHESDISMMTYLADYGYEEIKVGSFMFCISPLNKYTEKKNPKSLGAHDVILKKQGKLIMKGWWIDERTNQPYDSICVEINNQEYYAEQIERFDVAATYDKEDYLWSGYQVEIPEDTFPTTNYIVITGITEEGEKIMLYEFFLKE